MAMTLADLMRSGKTPEEINAILSGSTMGSGTLDPNFMAGEPYMPPQAQPMNSIMNTSSGREVPLLDAMGRPSQSQPAGPALDYSSPIEMGGMGKGYRLKGDSTRAFINGQVVSMGRDTGAERARMKEELAIAKARQELANGDIESQVKRAQLMELMGQDPSQMGMPQGMPPAPSIDTPPTFPERHTVGVNGQVTGPQQQYATLSQKVLERRYGKPEPGERWDNQGNAIPIPGHVKPIGEAQKKQVTGVQNLTSAIDEYQSELKNWSALDIVNPNKRARMGLKYNNMMLQAKEAYNLGVLNGPDLDILTSVVTDPRSLTGAVTSNEALYDQASELKRIMQKVGENASNSAPSVKPSPAGNAPAPSMQESLQQEMAARAEAIAVIKANPAARSEVIKRMQAAKYSTKGL